MVSVYFKILEYSHRRLSFQSEQLPNDPLIESVIAEALIQVQHNVLFDLISNGMSMKEQPKPDLRARYESDGDRFLPDSKKHPMSIEVSYSIPFVSDYILIQF